MVVVFFIHFNACRFCFFFYRYPCLHYSHRSTCVFTENNDLLQQEHSFGQVLWIHSKQRCRHRNVRVFYFRLKLSEFSSHVYLWSSFVTFLSKVQLRLLYPFYQGSWTWFYSWLATGIAMKLTVFFLLTRNQCQSAFEYNPNYCTLGIFEVFLTMDFVAVYHYIDIVLLISDH